VNSAAISFAQVTPPWPPRPCTRTSSGNVKPTGKEIVAAVVEEPAGYLYSIKSPAFLECRQVNFVWVMNSNVLRATPIDMSNINAAPKV
jgi:hypothetical protein